MHATTEARTAPFKDSGLIGTQEGHKASIGGGSGTITYSTLANVPKAKRQKLIAEAKPMVNFITVILLVGWRS